jgi:hypothetical protein
VWKPYIQARLKNYSVEYLKKCIDTLADFKFPNNHQWDGLEQIVKSDERVEVWLNRSAERVKAKRIDSETRTQLWVKDFEQAQRGAVTPEEGRKLLEQYRPKNKPREEGESQGDIPGKSILTP